MCHISLCVILSEAKNLLEILHCVQDDNQRLLWNKPLVATRTVRSTEIDESAHRGAVDLRENVGVSNAPKGNNVRRRLS